MSNNYHQPAMPSSRIERSTAWTAADLQNDSARWLIELNAEQIADLEQSTDYFLSQKVDIAHISKRSFPITSAAEIFENLHHRLLDETGLVVIKGLPIDTYDNTFTAAMFCGVGCWLGSLRSQNAAGHLLGHVRNTGASSTDTNTRIYQTRERQTFHTDSADVVGLLCLKTARRGGRSLAVSAESLFNRMLEERPDLLEYLFAPIATDRRGEVPPGENPFFDIPVFSWYRQRLTVMYQRQYIESAQRFEDVPRLSSGQIEALDYFDRLANDPDLYFSMQLEPGDMQFVYNHSLLHDRTGFEDWPEPERRRHLLRLWVSMPQDRELPEIFKQRFGAIDIGNRGGIVTESTQLCIPSW